MKELIKRLTIDKDFIFLGQFQDLNEVLKKSKDINYQMLSEREIQFSPTISWGTGGMGFKINVRALVSDLNSDRLKINIKTSVRPEHYFIIVLFIFFFIGIISSNESKWHIVFVFGLWIICHSWFQFIYRLQEKYLLDKIVKRLRLSKM